MPGATDHELEFLLRLDGFEFHTTFGYRVKIEARRIRASTGRPHGVKYSLTLHDPGGRRLYGIDNAHRGARGGGFDHRHVYGARNVVKHAWRGPVGLPEDFYREVERIMKERGTPWP